MEPTPPGAVLAALQLQAAQQQAAYMQAAQRVLQQQQQKLYQQQSAQKAKFILWHSNLVTLNYLPSSKLQGSYRN